MKILNKQNKYGEHILNLNFTRCRLNVVDNRPSRKSLDSLSSLYDLSVFQLNSLDKDIDPDRNFHSNKIRSKYYFPHSFAQFIESKQLQSEISFLHTNIRSLKKNLEEFQHHVLSELNFRFTVIGVSETRICDRECSSNFVPELPGYYFESVPTPLSAGGVGLFIDQNCKYRVFERVSNSRYQALWIELHLPNNKKSVCGVTYRQHNNANEFLDYLSDFLERLCRQNINIYIMGDFNIDLLYETCSYTQTLLQTMQSFSMFPVVDKPTRVHGNSATFIDNIFINNPENNIVSGNIVSDTTDHYSQMCILTSQCKIFFSKQISKSIGIIAKIRHYVPRRVLLSVYNSLIVPYLTYGVCAWGNCALTSQRKIVNLQKRVLRLIYFNKSKEHAFFLKSNCLPLPSLFFTEIVAI